MKNYLLLVSSFEWSVVGGTVCVSGLYNNQHKDENNRAYVKRMQENISIVADRLYRCACATISLAAISSPVFRVTQMTIMNFITHNMRKFPVNCLRVRRQVRGTDCERTVADATDGIVIVRLSTSTCVCVLSLPRHRFAFIFIHDFHENHFAKLTINLFI